MVDPQPRDRETIGAGGSEPIAPVADLGPAVATAVIASAGWVVTSIRPQRPPWLGPLGIVVTAVGGLAFLAAVGGRTTPIGFCVYAVLTACVRLPGERPRAAVTSRRMKPFHPWRFQ